MHLQFDRLHLSPSDVTAFLACEHLTTLSLRHARGDIARPDTENEQAELIFRKGLEHERAYLEHLRAEGNTILELPDPEGDFEEAARVTEAAIHAAEHDVIYQAVLAHEGWRGVADFLLRQLEDRVPFRAELLEVGPLVLEPLAEDELRLLILDLGLHELPARVAQRERRQVLASEKGRDVGRREVEAV